MDLPCARRSRMNVSITTPLSTATPDKAMNPTAALIENGRSRNQRLITPPVSASGTPLKTIRESLAEPKAAYSSEKMSSKASGTTMARR